MLKHSYFENKNFYKKETINSLSQLWLKQWLREIISYVKHLAKSLVVNIWPQKYLLTISVSNIAYKCCFSYKNICLMQCYKVITNKNGSDCLLINSADDSTGVENMIFGDSPYRSFLHVSWLHSLYFKMDEISRWLCHLSHKCSFSADMFLVNFPFYFLNKNISQIFNLVFFRVVQLKIHINCRVMGNKSSNFLYRYLFRGAYNGGNLAKFKAGI